jgi:hypothetical protein
MANNSLTIHTNRFFALVLKSPIQMGWLSIINSVTNISRLGTFKGTFALWNRSAWNQLCWIVEGFWFFEYSMGFKQRLIDNGKKISFYFLQHVWKCTFLAYAFKICKKCSYVLTNFFHQNEYKVSKNEEFYADSKFVQEKSYRQKSKQILIIFWFCTFYNVCCW